MAVRVGSARHDENGKLRGGKAGDQTGVEVSKQNWYLHKKGWIVIRAKSAEVREKIAKDMEYACANPNIGYDQSQNYTLYNAAKKVGFDCSKVTTKVETDCSRLVRVCLAYAGIDTPVFYTGNQVETLKKTGKFDFLTSDKYCTSSNYLLRGDILVTKVTGHTVVVLNDGSKASKDSSDDDDGKPVLKNGSKGTYVKELQTALNKLGYKDADGKQLLVDGKFGDKTEYVVREFQEKDSNYKSKVDGVCGPKTWAALEKALAKIPSNAKKVKATTNVYVRKGPSKAYASIKVLKKGSTAIWDGKVDNGWYHLSDISGWVSSKYVEVV